MIHSTVNPLDIRPKVVLVDCDNSLINGHLSNELFDYMQSTNLPAKSLYDLNIYDYSNKIAEYNIALLSKAKQLVANIFSFNNNVISQIIAAFDDKNTKIGIVTFSSFSDVIYELIVEELTSKHHITLNEIQERFKVIGGFPKNGQDSPNCKQEHVLKALSAFGMLKSENINANNITDIFKNITLIDDSRSNIEQALACGMKAILVRKNGTLDMNPKITGYVPKLDLSALLDIWHEDQNEAHTNNNIDVEHEAYNNTASNEVYTEESYEATLSGSIVHTIQQSFDMML